ncbi:MAG: glutaminyl-peptide cyclotransferase [Pseudomonadota bacterium]
MKGSAGRSAVGQLLLLALAASVAYGAVPVKSVEVINTYPHDASAFTQGLVSIDGVLYEGTGRNGESSLRKVELATGAVQQRAMLPAQHFGEGITVLNNKVYQLTWQTHVGFVYDLGSFKQVQSFYLPGEGWGITHDGKQLIVSDGTANLRFLDPVTLKETSRVAVTEDGKPLDKLNELEYINGEVWANVWYTNFIVRIDPVTGVVNSKLDLSDINESRSTDDVLNGIAWDADSQRLFVTGKLWSQLYEIKVRE